MPVWFQWILSIVALVTFASVIWDTAALRAQRRRDRQEVLQLVRSLGRRVAKLEAEREQR